MPMAPLPVPVRAGRSCWLRYENRTRTVPILSAAADRGIVLCHEYAAAAFIALALSVDRPTRAASSARRTPVATGPSPAVPGFFYLPRLRSGRGVHPLCDGRRPFGQRNGVVGCFLRRLDH